MSVSPDIQTLCQNKSLVAPTIDSEREEFRKYLESSGMLDVLTRVMKDLYELENKPADPLSYLTNSLGVVNFYARETALLQDELRSLKLIVKQLEEDNRNLREKLEKITAEYLLGEIVTSEYQNILKLPLREKDLKQAVLDSVDELHGDFGWSCIHNGFSIKMYNAMTRTFILRVRRQYHPILSTSLVMMTSIGKIKLGIRTLHLSGTIRSAYKFLVNYDKQKMQQLIRKHRFPADAIQELSAVIEESHHRFAKKKFD